MTISIEPTDFGEDIMASVTPFLGALGLLDNQGKLDINGWSMEKALAVFGTYERTEFILNMLAGYISSPSTVYRELATGLIVEKGERSPNEVREEEWFPISKTPDWSVNLTVYHQKLNDYSFQSGASALPQPSSPHSIEIGLGISIDGLEIPISSGPLELSASIGIPIVEVRNELVGNEYKIENGIPTLDVNRLLWEDSGNPLAKVGVLGKLQPLIGRFEVGEMSASGVAIRSTIGKESPIGASNGLTLKLSLLDFIAKQGNGSSTLEVDLVNLVTGGGAGFIDQIVPTLIQMIPGAAGEIADQLLPILGLMDSDWSSWNGQDTPPSWPRMDIKSLIGNLPNFNAIWGEIQQFLLALATPACATQWLHHFSSLIFFGNQRPPIIEGDCTKEDPISLQLISADAIDAILLLCITEDMSGSRNLEVGIKAQVDTIFNSQIKVVGQTTVWFATIPLTGVEKITFVPRLSLDVWFSGDQGNSLIDIQADDDGTPLANLQIDISKAHFGLEFTQGQGFLPVVELLDVQIGAPPDHQSFPIIDLTSGASVLQALEGALQGLLNAISDALALHPVLQWAGSLLGLVAPRGYPFRRVDAEFSNGVQYVVGDVFFAEANVYRVTVEGESPDEGVPTHGDGLEIEFGDGTLKLLHLGPNTPIWETNDANDKRINLLELMQNPVTALSSYHLSLLSETNFAHDGEIRTAWVYVFEALGNLVNTVLAPILDTAPPKMLTTSQTETTGEGLHNKPWKMSIGDDGSLPDFSLVAHATTNNNGDVERVQLGLATVVAIQRVAPTLHLEVRCRADILSVPLVQHPQQTIPIILPMVGADVMLHDAFNNHQIELLRMPGMKCSIEGLRGSLEWHRSNSFGFILSIESPRIGSIAPDFNQLCSQLTPAEVNEFQWRGGRLRLPNGTYVRPNLESFTDQDDDPEEIQFTMPETNQSITIPWNFFGLGCPSVGFNSFSGVFGLIDSDPNANSLIDLEDGQALIENEGVRLLAGQLLSRTGGQLGYFLSTFLRIHPHLLYYDLGVHLQKQKFRYATDLGGPSNWPSNWAAYHPRRNGVLGLGPFSLPYDWPEVDWLQLVNTPVPALKSFITQVFSGISLSGEPFALPALRWAEGIFKKVTPDLSSASLGWQIELVNDNVTVIPPKISEELVGEGSYSKPWRVQLSTTEASKAEMLIWLDPDGPNSSNQLENVLSSSDMKLLEQLESETTDFMRIVQQHPDGWQQEAAHLLKRLANFSPRIQHAIADVSVQQLAEDIFEVDQFFKLGDGFSTYGNQIGAMNRNVSSVQQEHYTGTYISSFQNHKVIGEILNFVTDFCHHDWSPNNLGTEPVTLLILHNLRDFEFSEANGPQVLRPTYKLNQFINEQYSISPQPFFQVDWDEYCSVNIEMMENHAPTVPNGAVLDVRISSRFNQVTGLLTGMGEQIRLTIQKLTSQTNGKVAIVAHGMVGVALQNLVDDLVLDETKVVGILKLNVPDDIVSMQLMTNEKLRRGIHLLSLIENQSLEYSETTGGTGVSREIYLSKAELVHTARTIADSMIQLTKEG